MSDLMSSPAEPAAEAPDQTPAPARTKPRTEAGSRARANSRGPARTGGRAPLRAVGDGEAASTPAGTPTRDWCTPPALVAAVREAFGGTIDLDPCSNEHSLVGATREYCLPDTDGLAAPWDADRIFVNPPTGRDAVRRTRIADWFARIDEAAAAGSEVIALVPVATNTAAWKAHVYPRAASICFLAASRVKFHLDGREDPKGAPMACAVIYFGTDVEAFEAAFAAHGTCLRVASTLPAPLAAPVVAPVAPGVEQEGHADDAGDRPLEPAAQVLVARALAILDQRSPIIADPVPAAVPVPPVSVAGAAVPDGAAPAADFALSLVEALDAAAPAAPDVPVAPVAEPAAGELPPLSRAGRRALRRTVRKTEKRQRKAAKLLQRSAALTEQPLPFRADDDLAPSLAARLARRP